MDRKGNVPNGSGLNWHRDRAGKPTRTGNEAYLHVAVSNRDFFPERGQKFNVLTDDGKIFQLTPSQSGNKGLA